MFGLTHDSFGPNPNAQWTNSPLLSWVHGLTSVQGFSAVLGVIEVGIAVLIAARPFAPRAAALGSLLAVGMFLTTLSATATEGSNKEQANMATHHYTRGVPLAVQEGRGHTTAREKGSLSGSWWKTSANSVPRPFFFLA